MRVERWCGLTSRKYLCFGVLVLALGCGAVMGQVHRHLQMVA